MATYNRLLADDDLGFELFLAVIVAPRNGSWEVPHVGFWCVDSDGRHGALLM